VSLRRAATPGALAAATRAAEACGLYVEDLDLRRDDEHVRIHGKGGTVRTVLLDDRGYVALLRLYLARAGYTAGPLFRASINGSGGPLSYDAATTAGRATAARPGSAWRSTSCATPTPPSFK
jgi:integrase/recombinase XerC/integrase/recombinase XerD